MKTIKSRLFKKYLERKKILCFLKIDALEIASLLVQDIIKYKVWLFFCPTLALIFSIFRECEKGKSCVFKKASLKAFKE